MTKTHLSQLATVFEVDVPVVDGSLEEPEDLGVVT